MISISSEDLIEVAEKYIEQMQTLKHELDTLHDKLESGDLSPLKFEDCYGQEFEITMLLSGAKYDLNKILNSITDEQYMFMVNRFRKEADELFDSLVLE